MNNFTAPEIITILAALGVLITATAAAVVSIIVSLRTSHKVDVGTAISASNSQAIARVDTKADVIAGHVNSAATAAAAEIKALQAEVAALQKVSADNKEIAALLAQSAAGKTVSAEAAEVKIVNEPSEPVPVTGKPLAVTKTEPKKKAKP